MDLNRVEWSKAQDLLLKLVQVLAPLADKAAPASFFLNKRFFVPPTMPQTSLHFRHPVQLLTTLHSVQKQVEELLGEKLPQPPTPQKAEKEAEKSTQSPPLSRQAQRLIDQVQDAIGKLCQSTNLKDPKEEPLREALKRLKPNLDRIIEVVTHEEMHSADDGLNPQAFRFALPRPSREHLVKKQIPFPPSKPKETSEEPLPLPRKTTREAVSPAKASERGEGREKPPASRSTQPHAVEGKPSLKGEQQARPTERTTLPGAPFVPETRSLTPARKKKKRKGFWFRDDQEEEKK